MMHLLIVLFYIYNAILSTAFDNETSINGMVNFSMLNHMKNKTIAAKLGDKRRYLNSVKLEIDQIYPYKNDTDSFINSFFSSTTQLLSAEGHFTFNNVPLDQSSNNTYFVIKSSSKYFNLSPNRILVSINNANTSDVTYRANFVGKDYFPALELLHPDTLPLMNSLTINLASEAPIRDYVLTRNDNIFATGFIGSIFESKWKTAGLTTAIFLMAFPYIIEYIDPEAAAEMKERKKQGGRK
ncbi:hypothetical protein QEN19_002864 [Hanseniaspora menglaensis]